MKKNIHDGDLVAKAGMVYDYTRITGSITTNGGEFPKLETVGGDVRVDGSAKLDALETVGGDVRVDGSAKLDALETVGGAVIVCGSAKLDAPKDVKQNANVSPIRESVGKKCRAILLSTFDAAGFSFADGILARIVSQRGQVSRVVVCGKKEVSFLVTDGEAWSHGKTLAEARDGLLYKIGNRDKSEFAKWTPETVVSKRDAIRAYRTITGACEGGVQAWMEQRQTPDSATVKEIIGLTAGAYGADTFKAFFSSRK